MHGMGGSHKHRVGGRAARGVAAITLCFAAAGCGLARGPLTALDLPPTELPEGTPWPRLADVPDLEGPRAPPKPDPATGREVAEALTREAAVSAAIAEELNDPVLSEAEIARLRAAVRASLR
jgi:hypothetical protein